MVYRIYTEKNPALSNEASSLCAELSTQLGISLKGVRLLNRYDVENLDEKLFEKSINTVFSEPQLDFVYRELPENGGAYVFAVEYLPGQFDQRADSAAQCIQLLTGAERPVVRTARVYYLDGELTDEQKAKIEKYIINPVESRKASLQTKNTLKDIYDIPTSVETLNGFIDMEGDELAEFVKKYSLAMDADDIRFCRDYFRTEKRDPTITEIRMIDTYWSDHCRHTTFLTTIDSADIEDEDVKNTYDEYIKIRAELGRTKPINLMDIATIGARYLKVKGKLPKIDESEEINACTVKVDVDVDGEIQKWLLLFKNETHNHPTEIEPFGGAATCIGGAIRDPLSGRAYVYQAMRVTGAADPHVSVEDTIPGKLQQRKIVTTAAAGYSSYGNQIGLATGQVDEIYHPGYVAKRLEIGTVVGAAPEKNVVREVPDPGDIVVLLGGRTGRDGCGGATGSSKSHTAESIHTCGAEVQKGNAPEERKLQRLMRNPEASTLIKRCNDFGAGGVSVAIGELADGLYINLDAVPKKYDGLDGTELAISESQERMAVVLDPADVEKFISIAKEENLESTIVATVTEEKRLKMEWCGNVIVDISRDFLNSNGAEKHIGVSVADKKISKKTVNGSFTDEYKKLASDYNVCSKRGLSERFDSTIGASTVLMPFGGKYQRTPAQTMIAKLPVGPHKTNTASVIAWGYNPFIMSENQYVGAYLSVVESLCKLACSGVESPDMYLTFQEYFEKPKDDPARWGKPFAALLGALKAQLDFGIASIGGKDSMSGTFENIDVPPTLVSYAVGCGDCRNAISPEFKKSGSKVIIINPEYRENGLPTVESLKNNFALVGKLIKEGKVLSAYTPVYGGVAEGIMKMSLGNKIGFAYDEAVTKDEIFGYSYGSFILELSDDSNIGKTLGYTTEEYALTYNGEKVCLCTLEKLYEDELEDVYSCNIESKKEEIKAYSYKASSYPSPKVGIAKPKFLIPVFPGTNCEYDTEKAIAFAGGEAEIFVINNMTSADVTASAEAFAEKIAKSQVIFVPGGFSGGDEPEGSGKFITAFFRNPLIHEKVDELLNCRDGLMAGICNGFQALIKLGLVPFGKIVETDVNCPTLTFNTIGRHQSKIVNTRVASNKSPWLSATNPDEIYAVPISHGEGRFICPDDLFAKLVENGQIATQYVDPDGKPTFDIAYNPNGSYYAVEGITSPDGRILGKMGHTERYSEGLYKNVPGNYDMKLFESAVKYFKI